MVDELQQRILELEEKVSLLEKENQDTNIYRHFFYNSLDLVCIANNEGRFIKLSPSFSTLLGYSNEELLDKPFTAFIHPDDLQKTLSEISLNQTGQSTLRFENRYIKKNGDVLYLQWVSTSDPSKNLSYAVARDVTEIKRTEKKLRRSQELLNAAQSMAKMGSWSFNLKTHDLFWSDELFNIFAISEEERAHLYDAYISRYSPEGLAVYHELVNRAIEQGEAYKFRHSVHLKDGTVKMVSCAGIPFKDENGKVYRIDGMVQDVTEETENEKLILKNIREKEILIKELHHRVKNNMQVISSLLNLQATISCDKRIQEIFKDSQERIRSMAVIHDMLYRSNDISMIDFKTYIDRLANELIRSHKGELNNIELKLNIPNVHYEIDVAVPLGLIINEILTNALKHAFPDDRMGKINIDLQKTDEHSCKLSISDDGNGFNLNEIKKSNSLGIMIMENLSEQLEGKIEIQSTSNGTLYELEFSY